MRAFGFGFSAVLVGLHLERAGLSPGLIGLTLGLGLAAASLSGLAAVVFAARFGRRATLAATGLLMTATGLDLGIASQPALLVLAGLTGMLGAGNLDLGPFAPIEQTALAEIATPKQRNLAFGRYALIGGLCNAGGGLIAGIAPPDLRGFFLLYAVLGATTALIPAFMSRRAESDVAAPAFGALVRRETAGVLVGLAALFAVDSFAGGFVVNAVISYWLHVRFGASAQVLGPVFAALAFLQSISFEISGRLSSRIGLINTMVFTHLPSNVLLVSVAFSPTLGWAVALLLARFLLSQMDVPARQAYVVSIVPREDRAAALAVTGAVRGVAQAFGPVLSGIAIGAAAFALPFYAGGGLKIVYDAALFAAFRNRRAEHEI